LVLVLAILGVLLGVVLLLAPDRSVLGGATRQTVHQAPHEATQEEPPSVTTRDVVPGAPEPEPEPAPEEPTIFTGMKTDPQASPRLILDSWPEGRFVNEVAGMSIVTIPENATRGQLEIFVSRVYTTYCAYKDCPREELNRLTEGRSTCSRSAGQ